MSDEANTPQHDSESAQDTSQDLQQSAAPNANVKQVDAAKQKKVIKIGSQRPGYVPDTPKKKDQAPQIPPRPKKSAPKIRVAADPQATVAAEGQPTSSEPTGHVADAVAQNPKPETDGPSSNDAGAVSSEATAEPKPGTDQPVVSDVPSPDASMVSLDAVNLEMSDEELEQEIAAAMGENVENLMAGQVSPSGEEEVKIDGRYEATVLRTLRESVLFDLPGPYNGAVPLRHFSEPPEPGSKQEILVVGFAADEQLYNCLVPGGSVEVVDWSDIQEGVVVEATVTGHNKGGLECEVNHIRGFMPISQIALYRVDELEGFVGQKLPSVITEANPGRGNLVLSHRAVLEREREEAREKLLAELAIGQVREGTVTRLQNFGAFVDIGGIDGLIHISQLSWDNIRHPSEVVAEGQQVRVRIDKLDKESGKIGLSYRDLMHHPWEGIDAKYPVNELVKGTVSKIMDFGAFVKLEPGVEGLVHISELSHKRVNRVSHVVEEGQRVEVKVLSVDEEAQRISLSMKAAQVGSSDDSSSEEDETPTSKPVPKIPVQMLRGGTGGRKSDGEQFGLKW